MRKVWLLVLLAALLLAPAALAEEITFQDKFTVDTSVESIDFGEMYVKDLDALCDFIDQLPNLKKVDMYKTTLKKKQVDMLAEKYPHIEFGWTIKIGDDHVIRTDQTAFSTLHNNKSKHHTSADFSVLKYCKKLLALDIGHNAVDDLSFLYDLPQLKVLIIACNQITDITPLAALTELEYLEVFKNKVTDLTPLAGLTKLIDLNICFNRVSDWTPIEGLTGLRRLWLFNSNNYSDDKPVPKAAVNALKEALPDAYIDSTHYSTTGGWREHPRYNVIFEMFKSGVYIPFPAEEAAAE